MPPTRADALRCVFFDRPAGRWLEEHGLPRERHDAWCHALHDYGVERGPDGVHAVRDVDVSTSAAETGLRRHGSDSPPDPAPLVIKMPAKSGDRAIFGMVFLDPEWRGEGGGCVGPDRKVDRGVQKTSVCQAWSGPPR